MRSDPALVGETKDLLFRLALAPAVRAPRGFARLCLDESGSGELPRKRGGDRAHMSGLLVYSFWLEEQGNGHSDEGN
jgi:hypothetical protein